MATLHIHDVARIAYEALAPLHRDGTTWGDLTEDARSQWRGAAQMVMDGAPPITVEHWVGIESDDAHQVCMALVNACRPFVEES